MAYIPYGFIQKPTGIYVEPQQAKVVQQIYQRYLEGDSLEGIADFLFQEDIPSPQGKERWTRPVINSLLSNQKYIGYIISFDDFFIVQGGKGKRSNIDEDTGKLKGRPVQFTERTERPFSLRRVWRQLPAHHPPFRRSCLALYKSCGTW